jgi:hypothetical protein
MTAFNFRASVEACSGVRPSVSKNTAASAQFPWLLAAKNAVTDARGESGATSGVDVFSDASAQTVEAASTSAH